MMPPLHHFPHPVPIQDMDSTGQPSPVECRIIGPKMVAKMCERIAEFKMSPRELEIYLAGSQDGMEIKSDEVQIRLSIMESRLNGHDIDGNQLATPFA
jgi:hypothetical protein